MRNAARGFKDAALFEIGPAFADDTPNGQTLVAGGIRAGASIPRNWAEQQRPVDAFDAKADVLAALAAGGIDMSGLKISRGAPAWFHPGRSGVVTLADGTEVAHFGEIHPKVLKALDASGPFCGFEIFLDRIPAHRKRPGRPLLRPSPYQAVERDFAFVLKSDVAAETVVNAAASADHDLITDVIVFDLYEGKGIPQGQKSLAISVRLEPQDRTLTESEIEAVTKRIVANVVKATGGSLRS